MTALHNMPWSAAKRILILVKHTSGVFDLFIAWRFLFSSFFSLFFGLTTEYSLTSFVVHAKCTLFCSVDLEKYIIRAKHADAN